MSQKAQVLDRFDEFVPDGELVSFDELLKTAYRGAMSTDDSTAELFASETNCRKYWTWWRQRHQNDAERGLTPLFEVVSESSRRLRWRPSTVAGHPRRLSAMLHLMRSRPQLVEWLRAAGDRDYEKAGAAAFALSGASDVYLTRKGGDAGIDIYAAVPAFSPCHLVGRPGAAAAARVVVQCKKYGAPVGPEKMREFCNVLDAVRHRSSHVSFVPDWFRSRKSPIVGIMIGHSGFTSGARDLAADQGVVLATSLDVAEMAARSRQLDRTATPVARLGAFEALALSFS